jgi:hypothetical protein
VKLSYAKQGLYSFVWCTIVSSSNSHIGKEKNRAGKERGCWQVSYDVLSYRHQIVILAKKKIDRERNVAAGRSRSSFRLAAGTGASAFPLHIHLFALFRSSRLSASVQHGAMEQQLNQYQRQPQAARAAGGSAWAAEAPPLCEVPLVVCTERLGWPGDRPTYGAEAWRSRERTSGQCDWGSMKLSKICGWPGSILVLPNILGRFWRFVKGLFFSLFSL